MKAQNALRLLAAMLLVSCLAVSGTPGVFASTTTVVGALYTETNAATGTNSVYEYARNSDGTLTFLNSYSTTGKGRPPGLESQGGVILSSDNAWLFAVNAGSNSISVFAVGSPNGLTYIGTVSSNGYYPNSLTFNNNILYVLNSGTTTRSGQQLCGNISGFTFSGGILTPIPGSTQPLSTCIAAPSEILFSPDGSLLFVDERNTTSIDSYNVVAGVASGPNVQAAAGPGVFGFLIDPNNHILMTQAGNSSVSSYSYLPTGTVSVISNSVKDKRATACWIAITNNTSIGEVAYVSNTVSHDLSSYTVAADGTLTLLQSQAALISGSQPIDEAISPDGSYLYVIYHLVNEIAAYQIQSDGTLVNIQLTAIPKGLVGLAIR